MPASITSRQIRAARGLLNISQKELATKSGLSINSLNNIEREVGSPRVDSMRAIADALAEDGIEFLEKDGVRLAGEQLDIKRIEGPDILQQLYKEQQKAFPFGGGEIMAMGKDNSRFHHHDINLLLAYKEFEAFAIKNNIKERAIFLENDVNFLSVRNIYRWVPKQLFSHVPMTIFGNNVAIVLWGPPVRMIIIRNPGIAESFRVQFEAIWSLAKPVADDVHQFHYKDKTLKVLQQADAAGAPVKTPAKAAAKPVTKKKAAKAVAKLKTKKR